MLADAFGFESADDYGRANEATLSRLCAQARRARALAKVSAFVSRHGLAFSPPSSPPTISEQQVQVDYGRANEATLSRLRAQAYRLDNGLAAMTVPLTKAQSGRPPESAWAKMSPKWAKMSQKWAKMSQKWAKMGLNDPPKSGV